MIETARLRLRPFEATDAPKLFAMSVEAGIRRWIPDQVYADEAEAARVVEILRAPVAAGADPRTHPFVLGVEDAASGALIGHVGLSPARGSVEIGYAIEDAQQGRGFATEAVRALAAWGLRERGLAEILGIVATDNAGSIRVFERAGFQRATVEAARIVYRRGL